MKFIRSKIFFILFLVIIFCILIAQLQAAPARTAVPRFELNQLVGSDQFSTNITLLISIASIGLIPFFLMTTTSFLRIVIVLGLLRSAIGTQQVPPAPIIISLALFMSIFIMNPVWEEVNKTALQPYNEGRISQKIAWERGVQPLHKFMLRQTREKDLTLFVQFAQIPPLADPAKVPMYILIPAFALSELKTAFQIGFVIFLPFVVIDLIVANILLSLGMFMLSPVLVSLPFKILLFVLSDGWFLITRGLMQSFHYR
ncbi:MAG: flagellar type III secretion system pore protein FliP [Candidatus Margulisbacteria bacterium]|nr:flagellar type III secretion system pore protein FliP [Candidatus Margulisiibacteriota bacterium]